MIHDVVPEHKIWEPVRLPCTNHPHGVEAVSSRHTKSRECRLPRQVRWPYRPSGNRTESMRKNDLPRMSWHRTSHGADAEVLRKGVMQRDRRGGRRDTLSARRRDGGGNHLSRPHTHLPSDHSQVQHGQRTGQAEGQGGIHTTRATPGAGALRTGVGRCGRGTTTRLLTVGPDEPVIRY